MSSVLPIDVIEDNASFMVVYKPEGFVTFGQDASPSLLEHLQRQCSNSALYPIHRLDKDTSGLVLIAKTALANKALSTAFLHKHVKKHYVAICEGKPQKKQGKIVGDMVKSRKGSWKLLHTRSNPATTEFNSYSIAPKLRLYHLRPLTGKTHQLRVALKALSVPILGDERYGAVDAHTSINADRMYLHALRLIFNYEGQVYDIRCLPKTGKHFLTEQTIKVMRDTIYEGGQQ